MKRRGFLTSATSALFMLPITARAVSGAIATGGDRFRIGDQEFILSDIRAPSAYVLGETQAPFFTQAMAHLQGLIETTNLEIEDTAPKTRWNARVVKAFGFGVKVTLQEQMLAIGAARVAPQTDDHAFIDHLLNVERKAREGGRGIWALAAYRIVNALNANAAIDGYHVVEGIVVSARATRSRFYLNFGDDYRTDFTASAKSSLYRRWLRDEFDLAALEGAKVRIRGFVVDINGPSIDLTHRRQIEFSDPMVVEVRK